MNAKDITKELVKINSTNPGNYEGEMFEYLQSFFCSPKFSKADIRSHDIGENRKLFMVKIDSDNNEDVDREELVFICHMDTVPVGNEWSEDPFGAVEREGRIYGRGSCDMKSGMACALMAMEHAVNLRSENKLKHDIKFIATVDEEGDMLGVEEVIKLGWVNENSLVLDTEPTGGHVQGSHKGRIWFQLKVQGKSAHASKPWEGADAVAAIAEIIRHIRLGVARLEEDEKMGKSTVTFGTVKGGKEPYIVPDYAEATVDMRLCTPYTINDAIAIVEKAFKAAKEEIGDIKPIYNITGDKPPIKAEENSKLCGLLKEAILSVSGKLPEISTFTGYTDTAVIAARTGNKNCFSYGPGNLKMAHKPDEYVPVEDILRVEEVLKRLVEF